MRMSLEDGAAHPASDQRPVAMILVVDDEPDTLSTVQLLLSMLGFGVVTARSAREALERVEERLPDLIITDCAMPRMSGLELCRRLRTRESTRRIPLILHTAADIPDEGPRLYDRTITKPADIDAFLRTIQSLLPAREASAR